MNNIKMINLFVDMFYKKLALEMCIIQYPLSRIQWNVGFMGSL